MPNPNTEPHEVLIRFENGVYKGAHYQSMLVFRDDAGKVTNVMLNAAVPIKDAVGFKLADVLGQAFIDQDAALQSAQRELKLIGDRSDEADQLRAELIDVRGQLIAEQAKTVKAATK